MSVALQSLDQRLKRLGLAERLIRRNPLYYGAAQRQFAALQSADLTGRAAWTSMRLRRILRIAADTAYGKSVRGGERIEQWPLLDKELIRRDAAVFHAGGRWLRARANTGGTTGLPLKLIRSPESIAVEQLCFDNVLRALHIDPQNTKIAVLRGDSIKEMSDTRPPFWTYSLGGRRLTLSSNHLSERTLPHYIQALSRFDADLLWVYPTTLESLCLLLQRTGLRLHVKRVLSSSEMLLTDVWRLAKATLGCELADRYGQAERVAVAVALAPDAHYFVPGYAHVELIRQSQDGAVAVCEIVGTSLWNTVMPLVRYRTGDLIEAPCSYGVRELQEIALGVRPFAGVIGRAHDILISPDCTGVLTGIDHIQRGVERLIRLQVVQERPDLIVLRVLPAPGFSSEDADRLMRNARAKIPNDAELRLERASALQRTPSGKTPFVIRAPVVQEALHRIGFETS